MSRQRELKRKFARLNAACPAPLMAKVRAEIARVGGKGVKPGDTFADLVRRHAPDAFDIAKAEGFELVVDLPENTAEAMAKLTGMYMVVRPMRTPKTVH